ncbi:MAG: hypothetical protein JNJ88_18165 [Planctomycetes bacterium]|nr:hypothetical protein [Planctomycetota bacterium]
MTTLLNDLSRESVRPTRTVTSRIDSALHSRICELAKQFHTTPCAVVRVAIDRLLREFTEAPRDAGLVESSCGAPASVNPEVAP